MSKRARRASKNSPPNSRQWEIELVGSIEELLRRVDAVMLTQRRRPPHLRRPPVLRAKPLFIDKPFTASVRRRARDRQAGPRDQHAVLQLLVAAFRMTCRPSRCEPACGGHGRVTWGPATSSRIIPTFSGTAFTRSRCCTRSWARAANGSRARTHAGADMVTGNGRTAALAGARHSRGRVGLRQVIFGRKPVVSARRLSRARAEALELLRPVSHRGLLQDGHIARPDRDHRRDHGVHGGGRREQGAQRRARAVDRSDGGQVAGGQVAGAAAAQDSV